MDKAVNMQPVVDPYLASRLDNAYWQDRTKSAEAELERLREENNKYRAALEAVVALRHAMALLP